MTEVNSAASTDVNAAPVAAPAADTQVTAPADPSTAETKELEVVHEGAPINASLTQEEAPEEVATEESETRDSDDTSDKDLDGGDQPQEDNKRDASSRIRKLANENRELKTMLESALKSKTPEYDVDKAIDEGKDPTEARLEALEQGKVSDALNQKITELNVNLNREAHEVDRDFPFMDDSNTNRSPEDAEFAQMVRDSWFEDANVELEKDEKTGQMYITRADKSLYEYVKKMVDIRNAGRESALREGQVNAERQLASVEIPTGPAPKTDRSDDAKLSPEEYAAKHNLKEVHG